MLDQRPPATIGAGRPDWSPTPRPDPEAALCRHLDSLDGVLGVSRLVELGRILGQLLPPPRCQSEGGGAVRGAASAPASPQASAVPRAGEAAGRAPPTGGDAEHGRASPDGGEAARGANAIARCDGPDGPVTRPAISADADGQIPAVARATTLTYLDLHANDQVNGATSWEEGEQSFTHENVGENCMSPRRLRWWLSDELRPHQEPRVGKCHRVPTGSEVAVRVRQGVSDADTHAAYAGLQTCGSVWACPHCAWRVGASRAEEVKAAVQAHGQDRVLMLTLTVRHGMGDDLRELRQGVADAWRLMRAGKARKTWDALVGLVGMVRALEVTHGEEHGWHPHLHVLVFVSDVQAALDSVPSLRVQWQSAVRRALGEAQVPDDEHGLTLVPCHRADYVSKLGLEVAFAASKSGRGGNRGPWQIARDLAEHRKVRDVELWRDYTRGMKGARQLTWTRGLRERLGLGEERTDEELAEEELPAVPVALLDGGTWAALGRVPLARVELLELVEGAPKHATVVGYVVSRLGAGAARGVRAPP